MRRQPRRASFAIERTLAQSSPGTPLAAVQQVWQQVVGDAVADQADPVSEREGVVTVACKSATWAQELDLLQTTIQTQLNDHLSSLNPDGFRVKSLRFTADAARHGVSRN